MGTTDRLRARTADGTIARTTEAQYRALRYWAGNTADRVERGADPRPWPERAGLPAPQLQFKTIDILTARRWWIATYRGWVVTDTGRHASGLPPVHRDLHCTAPGCAARPGERCRDAAGTRYRDIAHDARTAVASPALRAALAERRRPAAGRPVDRRRVLAALDTITPGLAYRLCSVHDPMPVGYIVAT